MIGFVKMNSPESQHLTSFRPILKLHSILGDFLVGPGGPEKPCRILSHLWARVNPVEESERKYKNRPQPCAPCGLAQN